jgi:hypothetical protein
MEQIGLEGIFKTDAFASGLNKYTSGLSKAASQTLSTGSAIANAIGGAVMAGAAGFVALGAAAVAASGIVAGAISRIVFDASTLGDKYAQLSGQTGISTDRLQELAYAGKLLDVDLETMTSSLRFLTRNMYAAREGTGEQADAFKALGINVLDVNGKLRNSDTVWAEAIDALGAMENPTEADAIAMKLMGRNAMELNPLIKAGSKALAQYSLEAHEMGAVVSEEGIAALDEFRDKFDALKLSGKGIMASLALNFLPAFASLEDSVRSIVADIQYAMGTGDWGVVVDDISETSSQIMDRMKKSIPKITKTINKIIPLIVKVIKDKLPYFVKTGSEVLAALIKGIGEVLPTLIPAGIEIIKTIAKALKDNWPVILQAGKDLLKGLGDGIAAGWALIQPDLPTVSDILDWIFTKAVDLSAKLKAWVADADWSGMSQNVADAINGVDWSGLGSKLATTATNIGAALITMVKGIDWPAVGIAMGTAFDNAVIGALSGFGIGDVSNLEEFQTEWDNIGVQYGQTVGAGMAPAFWRELWKQAVNNPILRNLSPILQAAYLFDPIANYVKTGWDEMITYLSTTKAWTDLGANFKLVGENIGSFFQTYVIDPLLLKWAKIFTDMIVQFDIFLIKINGVLSKIGANQIPLIPLDAVMTTTPTNTTPAPSVSVPNIIPALSSPSKAGKEGGKSVTNNITVNNPSQEPASTSVSLTLRKLNYLGATS